MADASYIAPYIGSQDLEPYHSRPKNRYLNSTVALKRLDAITDIHFDRATVNYIGKLVAPEPTLSSWTVHTTSSNSAYAFAIGQIMLTRDILPKLPITPTSSLTAFNLIFRNSTTALDITNDPLLGLGKIGVISIKKEKYGDFIRANTLSAITKNQQYIKDAGSASKLHGIMVQEGPGFVSLTGSSYFAAIDAWTGYSSGIMFPDGLNWAWNSYLAGGDTSGWISYGNPSFYLTYIPLRWWGVLVGNGGTYSGVGVTGTLTSNKLFCVASYGNTSGAANDIVLVAQTASTSITANTDGGGGGIRTLVANFTTPTTGTVTAFFMCRSGASTSRLDMLEIREQTDWTFQLWQKSSPTQTDGSTIASKALHYINGIGWSMGRVAGTPRLVMTFWDDQQNYDQLASPVGVNINTGKWQLLTFSFSRSAGAKLYIDTTLVDQRNPWTLASMINSHQFNIGVNMDQAGFYNGNIGEMLWIKEYAVSQQDIINTYTYGMPTGYHNAVTVAHYYWMGNSDSTNYMTNVGYSDAPTLVHYGLGRFPSQLNALSAGYIYYDLGIVAIHGPSTALIDAISSVSSVNYQSSIKMTTLAAFCSAQTRELNYSTNDTAFYIPSITADPTFESTTALDDFVSSGFQWGQWPATADHSKYYLRETQNRTPYITTVGLYNEENELLLIGKLAQPIRKPKNIPITIKVQFDL